MEKLRVGILGGSRGMDFAMRMLLDYEYAEITAVCETYPVLRKKCEDFFRELLSPTAHQKGRNDESSLPTPV